MIESVFSAIDGALSFAPIWLRLAILGLPAGLVLMWLYGKLSDQDKIAEVQEGLTVARKEMNAYSGTDPKVVAELTKKSLSLAVRNVGLVFVPTIIAAAPVFLIVYGLDLVYGEQVVVGGLPQWLSTWEFPFLSAMSIGALVIKVALKIR